MTDLERSLEAWLGSGDIIGYFVAEVPKGPLQTGWLEQNIRSKSVEGSIRSKDNQSALIVPADRFVRLLREDIIAADYSRGLFVFGTAQLDEPRLIVIVRDEPEDSGSGQLVVALRTRQRNNTKIAAELLGLTRLGARVEPQIDYLEQMRADLVEGLVDGFLSLPIPKGRLKPKEWIRGSSSGSIAKEGITAGIENLGPIIARWITGLQVFEDCETPLAVLFLLDTNGGLVALWDDANKIAAFASMLRRGLEASIGHYTSPLWLGLPENDRAQWDSPRVTILSSESRSPEKKAARPHEEGAPEAAVNLEEMVKGLASRLGSIPIDDLERRLRRVESMSGFSPEDSTRGPANAQVIQRLRETAERLEAVTARMRKLEARIDRIAKGME
jgi:hypothetical protein